MRFRKFFLLAAALAALATSAIAQIAPAPQGNYTVAPYRPSTYSASYTAITTAASLTDFMTLTGSATKTVYLLRVECNGVTTAAGASKVSLVKRSTADTGGTPVTPSATAGGQLVPHDSASAAASATVVAYSANPTVGTLVGVVRTGEINSGPGATVASSPSLVWTFEDNAQRVILRGTGQVAALGGLGTAFQAGAVVACTMTWVEV